MSAAESKLVAVLDGILTEWHADDETGQLPEAEFQQVRSQIRDSLAMGDSPSSREPYQIADWIYWNCESASRVAAERYLAALTDAQVSNLQLGDVLACLSPGLSDDIEDLARRGRGRTQGRLDRYVTGPVNRPAAR